MTQYNIRMYGRMLGLRGLVIGPDMFLVLARRSYRQQKQAPREKKQAYRTNVMANVLYHIAFARRIRADYSLIHSACLWIP